MTPVDQALTDLRAKVASLIEQRNAYRQVANATSARVVELTGIIVDLRDQLASMTAERDDAMRDADGYREQLGDAQTINDQLEDAASARRYGRRLP